MPLNQNSRITGQRKTRLQQVFLQSALCFPQSELLVSKPKFSLPVLPSAFQAHHPPSIVCRQHVLLSAYTFTTSCTRFYFLKQAYQDLFIVRYDYFLKTHRASFLPKRPTSTNWWIINFFLNRKVFISFFFQVIRYGGNGITLINRKVTTGS